MSTTTEQQVRAIRTAISALGYELARTNRRTDLSDTDRADCVKQINDDIQALNDAKLALQKAAQFRESMKAFLA